MFIQDGIKFVQHFAGAISESTPHLYLSGLPFSPSKSTLTNMLTANFPNIVQVVKGQHEDWPSNQHILQGHTSLVSSVAFSPDGRYIVSGSWDHTIQVWDAQTGAQVGNPLKGHTDSVNSVAFSPDGRYIVSGSEDHTIQVWNIWQTSVQVGNTLQGHTNSVKSVAFSPDGRHIVSGSWDCTIRVWDALTGVQLGNPLEGHTSSVNSVAFSPNGRHIVSGSWDHTIQVWDAQIGAQVGNLPRGHTLVNPVAFLPDERHTVSGVEDYLIQCWDVQTESDSVQAGNSPIMQIQPHPVPPQPIYMSAAFMPSALPNSGGKSLTHMAKHSSRHLRHGLFLLDDGWIVGSNDQLFLWVPPSYHPFYLCSPPTRLIIGKFPVLDFSNMAHGSAWYQCFSACSDSM